MYYITYMSTEIPEITNKLLTTIISKDNVNNTDLHVYKYCKICGNKYTKSNTWHHKQTKVHMIYDRLNKRFKDILLNE